jgi:methylglutaconyl-CoA hydratase
MMNNTHPPSPSPLCQGGGEVEGVPLLVQVDGRGVCTLTLNRPKQRNALDNTLIEALRMQLQVLHQDPAIRVVVLTGQGTAFCSGADLRWLHPMSGASMAANLADARQLAELLAALYQLDKPIVARVNGPAYGGGLGLMACCDIAIAVKTANFAFTELRLGLVPAVIAPYVLAAIGAREARRYFLSAETLSAEDGLRIGLVHELAAPEQLDEVVTRHIDALLKAAPLASAECKQLLRRLSPVSEELREVTAETFARLRVGSEAREGITAFLEKRKPSWQS